MIGMYLIDRQSVCYTEVWAYYLRDLIPGAREVVEVDGAKLFFPEERPGDLVPHLDRHWGR
jgi:hypothetical protein